MPDPARVVTWDELPTDHPMELVDRARLIGERMMISHVLLHKGFRFDAHQHANEQIAVVLSGRVRFGLNSARSPEFQDVVVGAGQAVLLPSNCPHSAEALEDSLVLDCFSPPSEKTGIDQA